MASLLVRRCVCACGMHTQGGRGVLVDRSGLLFVALLESLIHTDKRKRVYLQPRHFPKRERKERNRSAKLGLLKLGFCVLCVLHEDCVIRVFALAIFVWVYWSKARKKSSRICSLKGFESKSKLVMQSLSIPSFFVVIFWSYVRKEYANSFRAFDESTFCWRAG